MKINAIIFDEKNNIVTIHTDNRILFTEGANAYHFASKIEEIVKNYILEKKMGFFKEVI